MSANLSSGVNPAQDADDTRRMAPVYIAVLVVEVIVLLAVWWFQEYFG